MSAPASIAFVSPRYAAGATVGGAETLLRELARRLAAAGRRVTFLTTCATNHFTWANELEPGPWRDGAIEGLRFPVDADRDAGEFLRVQTALSRGTPVSRADEDIWMRNSVNSAALIRHLCEEGTRYDRILAGPYLFGLVYHAARACPDRTLLVPCLHDEPFAYTTVMREMFAAVRGCLFNSGPERDLAARLYDFAPSRGAIVGMGLDPFDADPRAFAARYRLDAPYVLYSGRREPLKGTTLLVDYLQTFRERTGRDVRLALTGSGPFEPAPFIRDFGFLPEAEKHAAMAGAVAFIHPSTLESLGIVLLEAFLAGAPALVHAGGAVLRWQCARSGGGLWFRHYPDFEMALLRLLDDPALRNRLGAQGREFVRREYAWPEVERRLVQALDTL